jgi:3-oxoacyl-[acyl-carrier-protein] synthase-3
MFINGFGHYLPTELVANDYFLEVNGLSDNWIYERTGIKTRTKASVGENTNTMGATAVRNISDNIPYCLTDVDLIVGATYSPFDTVGTLAHYVQREFNIDNAKAISISSACSSFINAVEIVEGYFATNKSEKALIVTSEHNTAYSNEDDEKSGHLWGDGAAAILISKHRQSDNDWEIEAVYSKGLGHIGKGTEGVYLHPTNGGLLMPFGKDVFINACRYMIESLDEITKQKGYGLEDLSYIIPHQANARIIKNIAKQLNIDNSRIFSNIEELGNTGCASTLIALSENHTKVSKGDIVGFTVFGGGYSCGSMIVKR